MLIRKIISPLLILLYLSAVVGIAFYNCHCEHSQRLVLLTYNHCDCAHEAYAHENHTDCGDDVNCQNSKNACSLTSDGDCCKIVYKSIKIDQENTAQQIKASTTVLFALAAILPSLCDVPEIAAVNNSFDYSKSPPDYYKTLLIYHNCQLRL